MVWDVPLNEIKGHLFTRTSESFTVVLYNGKFSLSPMQLSQDLEIVSTADCNLAEQCKAAA